VDSFGDVKLPGSGLTVHFQRVFAVGFLLVELVLDKVDLGEGTLANHVENSVGLAVHQQDGVLLLDQRMLRDQILVVGLLDEAAGAAVEQAVLDLCVERVLDSLADCVVEVCGGGGCGGTAVHRAVH